MSIVKMPFTLAALVGFHITYTSPNSSAEGKPVAEGRIRVTHFLPIIKYLFWTITAVEIVTIIANNTKEFPISQYVLEALIVGGDAGRIRIEPLSLFATMVIVFASWLRKECYHQLGKLFTFELGIQADHKLVTTGPYAVVRHPGYTAGCLVSYGTMCFHGSRGSWLRESGILDTKIGTILTFAFMILLLYFTILVKKRCEKEDKALKKEFGKQWDEWAQRVPYAVLPGVL